MTDTISSTKKTDRRKERRTPPDLNTPGGLLGKILYSKYGTQDNAATAMGISRSQLAGHIANKMHFTKIWLGEPSGTEGKTRLQVLQKCPDWTSYGKTFYNHPDLKERKGKPLDMSMVGGLLGTILNSGYKTQEAASVALGINST